MKHFSLIFLFIVIAMTAFGSYRDTAIAASQSEDAHNGDLCGGTGGNGQIVNIKNNAFTIKRNDDGRNQIIHLTNQATIKTATGPISVTELKKGERVTLVGGPNEDGSFTADTVVLCSGIQKNVTAQEIKLRRIQTGNIQKINTWSSFINVATLLLVCLIWLGIVAFLRRKCKKSFVYLLFFTIFYIYLVKVLDYTLFQFQSLILLKHFTSGLMLNGVTAEKSLNLVPLITLRLEDVKTSLLNILLMVPFGFGLPFITSFRMKKIVLIGMLFSIGIECLQLITGQIADITFRIADINDVLFNTLGAAVGYMLFVGFMRMYRHIYRNRKTSTNAILRHIAERPQIDKN